MNYNFVLTHNDLDALGSVLCLRKKLVSSGECITYLENTNYTDLPEKAQNILKTCDNLKHNINFDEPTFTLWIMDVSFNQRSEMIENFTKSFDFVHLIDHHMYADGYLDEMQEKFSNFDAKVSKDNSKCASMLMYNLIEDHFGERFGRYSFKNLISTINAYDLWNTKSELFEESFWLNEYFREMSKEMTFKEIVKLFEEPLHDEEQWTVGYQNAIQGIKSKHEYIYNRIKNDPSVYEVHDGLTVLHSLDCFNDFVYNEMLDGQDVVVGFNSKGYVKVRVKPNVFTKESLDNFRKIVTGSVEFGHDLAFSVKTNTLLKTILTICAEYYNLERI
jgi:hypothetical protein